MQARSILMNWKQLRRTENNVDRSTVPSVEEGRFRSFRGIHGRGDVSLPQFIDGVVCMGSYRRGDTLWDIAHRRLQNTNGLRPLRSSPFVICYGHGHRSWHQDAIRLFGLLGGRCSILTGVLGA